MLVIYPSSHSLINMAGLNLEDIVFDRYDEIELNKIRVSEYNVRKTNPEVGLEELKQSISKFGLIHPVILIDKNDHFDLIAGQRRLLAFQQLNKDKIPALILKGSLNEKTAKIVSFSENIHRRKLPFEDLITTCEYLFKVYPGDKKTKIERISKDLGISIATVSTYVGYRLIPEKVRKLVDAKKLTKTQAAKITAAFWPNESKILQIANELVTLTRPQRNRAADLGRKNPNASVKELIDEAKKPPKIIQITISFDLDTTKLLEQIAKERETDIESLILDSVNKTLEDEKAD